MDNIFIERLRRSLKYEEVYLRDYRMVPEAGGHRPLPPVLQLRAAASEPGVSAAGGPLPEWRCAAMTRRSIRKEGVVVIGGAAPKPPEFSAFRPELAVFGSTIIEALERRIGLRRNAT